MNTNLFDDIIIIFFIFALLTLFLVTSFFLYPNYHKICNYRLNYSGKIIYLINTRNSFISMMQWECYIVNCYTVSCYSL